MNGPWWTLFATTFATVFVAELGDKTQLAALGLATAGKHPWAVFLGSTLALVLATALAVGAGKLLSNRIDPRKLHYAGATLLLVVGLVMLVRGPEERPAADAPPPAGSPEEPR